MTAWFVDAAIWVGVFLSLLFFILCQDFNAEVSNTMPMKKFVITRLYNPDKYYFQGLGDYEANIKRWARDVKIAMMFDTKADAEAYCRLHKIVGAEVEGYAG